MRLSDVRSEQASPVANVLAFAGYMLAAWLVGQTINSWGKAPSSGLAWSFALFGVVVAASTALLKDEWGIRARLGVTDFSGRRATLLWGALGVAGIFAVMTLPSF